MATNNDVATEENTSIDSTPSTRTAPQPHLRIRSDPGTPSTRTAPQPVDLGRTLSGELGIKLKELIENSSKNRTTTNLINKSDESKRYDHLFDKLIEVKQSIANMSSAMNKLYDHVSFTVNYINSQDLTSKKTVSECGIQTDIYPMSTNLAHINNQGTILKKAVCEIGIQTDVNPVNENLTQNKVKESIPSSFYELSTDLEGTKLEVTIAREVLPYDQSPGLIITNKLHVFKLP